MTIERYVEQIPADQTGLIQLPIERGPGNFLLFQSALALVTINLIGEGVKEQFANVNGGIYVRRLLPWVNLRIDGPIGTQVTYFYGSTEVLSDDTDIRQQVAVLAGVSAVADQPAAAMSEIAPIVCPNAALTPIVPVNFARRRVTLSIDSGGGIVFARRAGGANNLLLMEPGMTYQFNGTYAISVRNDSGTPTTVYIDEES
jgi:hypothetical protein